ncbi:ABC transporter substrate-binding protein [Kitasatospora arboriphila]
MRVSRAAAVVLAATTVLSSAACGSGSAGADGDRVRIGALLSLSGVYSTLGPAEKKAMTMGVEELNRQGFTVAVRGTRWRSSTPTTSPTRPPPVSPPCAR